MAHARRWKWAVGLLTGGLLAAGAGRITAFQEGGGDPEGVKAEASARVEQGRPIDPEAEGPQAIAGLADARIEAARKFLETARSFFEQGTINIDRYIGASQCLMESERDAARTKADEIAALRAHLERLKAIERREQSKFEVGSGSLPNLQEAEYRRREAEYGLARALAGHDAGTRPIPK